MRISDWSSDVCSSDLHPSVSAARRQSVPAVRAVARSEPAGHGSGGQSTMSGDIAHPSPLPFSVAFDPRDEDEVIRRWRGLLRGNHWSHGAELEEFEATWKARYELPAIGFDNLAGAAAAVLDFVQVNRRSVVKGKGV